jgi:hypothetical protein
MAVLGATNLTGCNSIPDFIGTESIWVFHQTSAPASWTKITTLDNRALRVTNGSITDGGSNPFTATYAGRAFTIANGAHTLTGPEMASHTHPLGHSTITQSDPAAFPASARGQAGTDAITYFPVFIADAGSNQTPRIRTTATAFSFNSSTGNLVVGGTVTASSDETLKTNINNIENALEKVLSLRGVEFNYIEHGGRSIGFIAQEVEKIIPELVSTQKDENNTETKSVAYQNFVAILVEAIKELNEKFDKLATKQV